MKLPKSNKFIEIIVKLTLNFIVFDYNFILISLNCSYIEVPYNSQFLAQFQFNVGWQVLYCSAMWHEPNQTCPTQWCGQLYSQALLCACCCTELVQQTVSCTVHTQQPACQRERIENGTAEWPNLLQKQERIIQKYRQMDIMVKYDHFVQK